MTKALPAKVGRAREVFMKLKFLGTGAAEGVPAEFCDCEVCREARRRGEREFRTRSQVLVDGVLSVDFPPDAYCHSLRFGVDFSKLRYLLVTHSHMDHFYAHDFVLRGYKYARGLSAPLQIYGNGEVKRVFDECTRREMRPDVLPGLPFSVVEPFVPVEFGGYRAVPLRARHARGECALVYLVEGGGRRYLHLTDTCGLPDDSLDFLERYLADRGPVDFAAFDCTFLFRAGGPGARHMGLPDADALRAELCRRGVADGHTACAITHFSHNSAPLSEEVERAGREYGFLPAFDGMEAEF